MNSAHKRVLLSIVAMVVLSTVLVGCGRGTVAKVDGKKISRQEYYNRLEMLPYRTPTGQQVESGAFVLQQLIDEVLVLRLAEMENVAPTEQQINDRMEQARKAPNFAANFKASGMTQDQFKHLMRVEQAVFNLQTMGVEVTDEEVNEYYESNKETQFTDPEMAEVAAIFTDNKDDADKALDMLKRGIDFGTVARTLSMDETSAQSQGRLPRPIVRGDPRLPEPVQQVLFSTARNKHTDVISDDGGGYVIFQMLNHRQQNTRDFRDVDFGIREGLMRQKGAEKNDIGEKLADLRRKADIDVSIKRYEELLVPKKDEAGDPTLPEIETVLPTTTDGE